MVLAIKAALTKSGLTPPPGPWRLSFLFEFAGKTPGMPHHEKPDTDNLIKTVQDCIVRSGAIAGDDCAVSAYGPTRKRWAVSDGFAVDIETDNDFGLFVQKETRHE